MAERVNGKHVPVETLGALLEGRLSNDEASAVRKHLAGCAPCSLELKRLERFARIEADEELTRGAEWLYARGKLERAYKERIAPAVVRPPQGAEKRRFGVRRPFVLVPIAAACAVAFIVVVQLATRERREPAPAREVMRGAPAVAYGITLKTPSGDIEGFPQTFSWETKRTNESYSLEIFAPSLERVYRVEGIAESVFSAPDSLRTLLKPNIIYLWNVKGRRGLSQTALSPNGWFRYRP
jgi:hypothetical protein